MKKIFARFAGFLLVAIMVTSLFTVGIFAGDTETYAAQSGETPYETLATLTFDFLGVTETYTYPGTGDGDRVIDSLQDLLNEYLIHSSVSFIGVPTNAVITLNSDVTLTESFVIGTEGPFGEVPAYDLTLDLNGHSLSSAEDAIVVTEGATVTIVGDGEVKGGTEGVGSWTAIWANGGHVIIDGGTYSVGGDSETTDTAHQNDVIYTKNGGTVVINGGIFLNDGTVWTLNENDANRGTITVKGGTFYNWNPEDNVAEGAGTNFCADYYESVDNGDGSYTVKASALATVKVEAVSNVWLTSTITVENWANLVAALGENTNLPVKVTFLADIELTEALVISGDKTVEIDLNGHSLSSAEDAIVVTEGATVTIVGDGEVKGGTEGVGSWTAIWANGGHVIINGGTYSVGGDSETTDTAHQNDVIYTKNGGTVVINGGTFLNDGTVWTLNENDANRGTITVKGGTFYNWNPEDNVAEGANTDFVAQNYKSFEIEDGVFEVKNYVEWVKAELLAGNDVTLDRDIVITDYDLVNALKLPSNGNGKYTEAHGNGAIFHVIKPGVVFDLNGHSITWDAHNDLYCNKRQVSLFMVTVTGVAGETADLTVIDSSADKTGKVDVYGMGTGVYVVCVDAKATISGGTWTNYPCNTCGASNIFLYPSHGGELYITDGTFEQKESEYLLGWMGSSEPTTNNGVGCDYDQTKVVITGGNFVGFNPEQTKFFDTANSGQETINGVSEEYKSVDNGDGTYTYTVKPLITVKFDDVTMVDGNEIPEFTYTFTGGIEGDEFMLVVPNPVVNVSGAGEYEITSDAYIFMNDKYAIEVIPGTLTVSEAVAQVGEVKYATLSAAIAAANAGDTVTLLADVTENVTVTKRVIIDGADFNYTGTMALGTGNVTIQNVNFVKGNISKAKGTASGSVTVKDCSFDGQGLDTYAINLRVTTSIVIENVTAKGYGYGFLQVPSSNNSISVKNVEISDVNYGLKIDYSNGVTLENVTIDARLAGVWDSNYGAKTYTIKNCDFSSIDIWERPAAKTDTFKFVGDNTVDALSDSQYIKYVLTEGATLTAPAGFTVTTTMADHTVIYEDGKYFAAANVYVTVTIDDKNMVLGNTIPEFTYTLSDAALADKITVNFGEITVTEAGTYAITATSEAPANFVVTVVDGTLTVLEAVAQIGEAYYGSIQDAVDAAQDGDTVVVIADHELGRNDIVKTADGLAVLVLVEDKNITLDMNGKTVTVEHLATEAADRIYSVIHVADGASLTVTGNGTIDVTVDETTPRLAYLFWKRGTTGTLVIENGYYHMNDSEDSMVYTNGNEVVTVKGGTFVLDSVDTGSNGSPWIFNVKGQNERHVVVSGGTYNFDISHQYWVYEVQLLEGYVCVDNGDGTYTVKPLITVKFDDVTITYGDELPEFTYTTDFTEVAGDGYMLVVGNPVINGTNAGEYAITADAYVFMSDEYAIEVIPGTLTIEKAKVTVTMDDQTKVYGDADPSFTYTIDTDYEGEFMLVVEQARENGENAGTYAINPEAYVFFDDNFEVEVIPGTLTIEKAKITVTFDDVDVVYGNELPEFTYTYATDYEGEFMLVVPNPVVDVTGAGEYAITSDAYVFFNDNFEVEVIDGTLTVSEAVLSVNGVFFASWNDAKATIDANTGWNKSVEIILYANVDSNNNGFNPNGTVTVDLNGFTWTSHWMGISYNTVVTVINSGSSTGKIVTTGGDNRMVLGANSVINLNGDVDFDGTLQLNNGAQNKTGYFQINGENIIGDDDSLFIAADGTVRLTMKEDYLYVSTSIGYLTLAADWATKANQTIVIGKNTGITVAEGVTLTVDPTTTLTINGTVDGEGTVVVNTAEHLNQFVNGTTVATVKLGDDIATDVTVDREMVLDLNGKTLTGNLTVTENGKLTVVDSTIQSNYYDAGSVIGTVTADEDALVLYAGTYTQDVDVYCAAKLMAADNKDGTWTVCLGVVYNMDLDRAYATIAEAMADRDTTKTNRIVLLQNHKESVVLVYDGTILNLQTYTLEADYVVVFKDGYLTAGTYSASKAYGQLKVAKNRVVVTEGAYQSNGSAVQLIWNAETESYVFGRFQIQDKPVDDVSYGLTADESGYELKFKVTAPNVIVNAFMKDGVLADHGIEISILASWTTKDGATVEQEYVYTDEMVQECFSSNKYYTFRLPQGDRSDVSIRIQVVSASGAVYTTADLVAALESN